jgi:PD-(D/E)XK nuclease superfamily
MIKLSPSDLTFLWSECPRCFYLKAVHNLRRPSSLFPSIFTRIDHLMKAYFQDKPSEELTDQLPGGVVKMGDRWVTSTPILFSGHSLSCYLTGKFDCLVEFNDGTYGVVDFKTSEAKPEHVSFYSRQLHAYAYALEYSAPNSLHLSPVSRLGLLTVEPVLMDRLNSGRIAYLGEVTWQECSKSYPKFLSFLEEVVEILSSPEPPESSPNCAYCAYRQGARHHNW